MQEISNFEYVGVDIGEDQYIIFEFEDLWRFLEDLFENEGINLNANQFYDIKREIVSKINQSLLSYYRGIEIRIDFELNQIKKRAIFYDENITLDELTEEKQIEQIENYDLRSDSPVYIDEIIEFENFIIHLFTLRTQTGNFNYYYFLLRIPIIKYPNNLCHHQINCDSLFDRIPKKIAFLGALFEHIFRDSLPRNICNEIDRFNDSLFKIENVLRERMTNFPNMRINNYFHLETRFLNRMCSRSSDFMDYVIAFLRQTRNDLIHHGAQPTFARSLALIIPIFEIFLFNINSFFHTLESLVNENDSGE